MLKSVLKVKLPTYNNLNFDKSSPNISKSSLLLNKKSWQNSCNGYGSADGGGWTSRTLHQDSGKDMKEKKRVHFDDDIETVNTKRSSSKKKNDRECDIAACGDGDSISKLHAYGSSISFWLTMWAARLQYLQEMDGKLLKQAIAKTSESFVQFCDNQPHLNLGSGPDFSSTYFGFMADNSHVAVKKINIKRAQLLNNDSHLDLLTSLNSESLAKVYFISRDKTHFYIVRELCECSLAYMTRMRRFIPEECRPQLDHQSLCYKVAKALSVLHNHELAHYALKPQNIFLCNSGEVKLADFQIHERSLVKKNQYSDNAFTLSWLPSEALGKNPKLTLASDIASLGIIFYWIITEGKHPFGDPENSLDSCLRNIKSGHYNLKCLKDPFAHHLIQHMIYREPEKRISIKQVQTHPYFWSKDAKSDYLNLMATAYCMLLNFNSDSPNCIGEDFMDFMNKDKLMLKKAPHANALQDDLLEQIDGSTKNILELVSSHAEKNLNVIESVLKTYPGFILECYDHYSTDDMMVIIKDAKANQCFKNEKRSTESSVQSSKPVSCPEYYNPVLFKYGYERQRGDSNSSTDDGVDLLSPESSFSAKSPFSLPIDINCKDLKSRHSVDASVMWSPKDSASSVDTNFEFDFFGSIEDYGIVLDIPITDMDELD